MAIVLADIAANARPALRLDNDRLEIPDGVWADSLAAARDRLEKAARATARVEIEQGVIPWVGTAFLIAPRLALTARYVADSVVRRAPGDEAKSGWLNFAADPDKDPPQRVQIAAVEQVHPYWGFSFLRLAEDAHPLPLSIAPKPPSFDLLKERAIVVIGYSSFDSRNDAEVQSRLFSGNFDIKRASPGLIVDTERKTTLDAPPMLVHDATTLGGSGGAPLIDLETGEVLGVHLSGKYLDANQAACAWEAGADPQWQRLWSSDGQVAPAQQSVSAPRPKSRNIFSFDEITAINDWLIEARISDDAALQTLFLGLSPEFMGSVPSASTIAERLALALDYLNDSRLSYGGRPPLYYVLTNARRRRPFDSEAVSAMDRFLEKVRSTK